MSPVSFTGTYELWRDLLQGEEESPTIRFSGKTNRYRWKQNAETIEVGQLHRIFEIFTLAARAGSTTCGPLQVFRVWRVLPLASSVHCVFGVHCCTFLLCCLEKRILRNMPPHKCVGNTLFCRIFDAFLRFMFSALFHFMRS